MTSSELIFNILGVFTAGTPKVLIYIIKKHYKGNKITIKNLIRVYIRFFLYSHARNLLSILFVLFILPHISWFIISNIEMFSPIIKFIQFYSFVYDPFITRLADNPVFGSISLQLAMITHSINFGLQQLNTLNLRFEDQFELAIKSKIDSDIILARQLKSELTVTRESILAKILNRDELIQRGINSNRRGDYHLFGNMTRDQHTTLSISETLATGRN